MSEERKFKAGFGNVIEHLKELYRRTEPRYTLEDPMGSTEKVSPKKKKAAPKKETKKK